MDKKTLLLSLVAITLAACAQNPVVEGEAPAGRWFDLGQPPSDTDPAAPGDVSGNKGVAGAPGAARADVIDFGAEPTGAATLSSVTCPVLAMPKASTASIVYVDAASTGAENGTKAAPFRTLGKAFGAATPGAVIWVAAGTYGEQLIVPNKSLTVLGGFARGFGSRTDACATVFEAPNSNAPVFAAPGDVSAFAMEGLTVQKGTRGLMALSDPTAHGDYTIARCVFAENGLKNQIGGAVALDGHNARIFGSVFRNNRAAKGAALAAGGDVKLVIDQNVILQNKGYSDHGGGLYINATSSKITRNTFRGNATGVGINGGEGGGWGGAVIIYSNALNQRAKADFAFNVFTENTAGIGGAVFVDDGSTVTMSHDLLYRNRAYPENGVLRGASLYIDGTGFPDGGSTFTAEYLTVVNNNYDDKGVLGTESYGGNVYVEGYSKASFTNSIFWNNGQNAFYVEAGENELKVTNSIGASGCTSGSATGLVVATAAECKIGAGVFLPAAVYFGDEASDDYHEKSAVGRYAKGAWVKDEVTSPAIDMADPSATADNEPMPNGNRANLGAFSRTTEASMSNAR